MDDDECPHGLEKAWCSLCKAASMPKAPPKPAATPRPSNPRSSAPRTPRPGTARPPRATPAPRLPATPAEALARVRPHLFHATAHGAWPAIRDFGLRTAADLAVLGGRGPFVSLREHAVDLDLGDDAVARVRDQRPLVRGGIEQHLDGISLPRWLDVMNERAFLFAQQQEYLTLLSRYKPEGQDVVVFDTAKLLAAASDRIEVSFVDNGAPLPFRPCKCRGRDTFVPLSQIEEDVAEIQEVTIVGGLDSVDGLVTRVVRYHPGGGFEQLTL